MRTFNAMVRVLFQNSPIIRIASLVTAVALLIGCAFGVWNAFTALVEKQENVTRLTYARSGDFGYSALYGNNTLYGNVTLTEKDTSALLLRIIENIEGRLSYSFTSEPPVQQATHTVRVIATLSNPDNWSKDIELIPQLIETGPFTVTYPIDTGQLLELAKVIEEQIGIQSSAYNFTIQATVHTIAPTDYGIIDELLTQRMTGILQATKLTWANEPPLSQKLYGSLQGTVTVPIDRETSRIAWSIALGIVFLLSVYVGWNYAQAKPLPLTSAEKEAKQAAKKHQDLVVEVGNLPEFEDMILSLTSPKGLIVSVNSLDELIKIAENLLKPVLHITEAEKHIYCVLDGLTRYEYVALHQPPEQKGQMKDDQP